MPSRFAPRVPFRSITGIFAARTARRKTVKKIVWGQEYRRAATPSLVGPRPQIAVEVATYADDVRRRLLVKPGMTGLWPINGRSELSWDESVRFDLYYVENWSVMSDLMILWRTGRAVMRASGAY